MKTNLSIIYLFAGIICVILSFIIKEIDLALFIGACAFFILGRIEFLINKIDKPK